MGDSLTLDSASGALTRHSEIAGKSLTLDSAPDALTAHSVTSIVGLDWERDGWSVSVGGLPSFRVSRDELLTMTFDDADYVVVEQSHMRERNPYSVSQVYTIDELRNIPFKDKIRLFPGMPGQLARAAREVGNVLDKLDQYGRPLPDKRKDAETMALYAAAHPEKLRSWKPFKLPDEDPARRLWAARDSLRNDIREVLNPLRAAWNAKPTEEKYELPEVKRFCELLDRNFDKLSDGVKEQFGIRRTRNGIRVDRMSVAITCYLAVYTREGQLRTRPDGKFIGIRFILDSIGMSATYLPNMARSQLTHHGMRRYKGGRDGGFRSEYMRNLRHFLQFLRDAGEPLTSDRAPDALTPHSDPSNETVDDSLTVDSEPDSLTHHSAPDQVPKAAAHSGGQ